MVSSARLMGMSYEQVNRFYRKNLIRRGTDVNFNDADPQGDGDQSPVPSNDAQFYRDMYAIGGDINHMADMGLSPLSNFSKLCVMGQWRAVQQVLEQVSGGANWAQPSPELIRLLETRETALRLSPLMLMASMAKNLKDPPTDRQVRVAELLLEYGARPDAKDVGGKTVCHYGLGVMSSYMTIRVVNLCIAAHQSSHMFGKKVQLHSLTNAALNGAQGWCKGYIAESGRRAVYLLESQKTMAIKPENLKLVEDNENTATPPTKLCDIPDRLGAVILLEVIQSERTDVAEILLKDHLANLDIKDCDGVSPRSLAINTAALAGGVSRMINKAAGREAQRDRKQKERTCSNCGKVEAAAGDLMKCAICKQVQYCGKQCQTEHWKNGGHKKVCKQLKAQMTQAVVLDRPLDTEEYVAFGRAVISHQPRLGPSKKMADGYRKPSSVDIDELFDVKVQGSTKALALLLYDKTRECEFCVAPKSRGFKELLAAVNAEPTWQGRKTYVSASFDKEGNCTVYPAVTSVHKW